MLPGDLNPRPNMSSEHTVGEGTSYWFWSVSSSSKPLNWMFLEGGDYTHYWNDVVQTTVKFRLKQGKNIHHQQQYGEYHTNSCI